MKRTPFHGESIILLLVLTQRINVYILGNERQFNLYSYSLHLKRTKGGSMADFQFEIIEHIGVLSTSPKGWTKELNMISWNGRPAKADLREWDPNHEKMGKGITLSDEEILALKALLESR